MARYRFNELAVSAIRDLLLTAMFATLYVSMPFVVFAGPFGVYLGLNACRQ